MKKLLFIVILAVLSITTRATVTHVTLTYYQPVKEQCDNKPLITADGSKINLNHLKSGKIRWCAISRDLLYLFPKGKPKRIYIEGFGTYQVRDVMNRRFRHSVDILIHPKNSKRIKLNKVKIKII
jgi:hypothetical protein